MQVRILTFRAMTALVFAAGPCLQAIAAQAPGSGAQPPKPVVMGDPLRRDLGVPDSSPNISGTWSPNTFFRVISPVDGSATPFLPWAREFFLNRNAAEARGEPLFDPNANCLPSGVPRVIPTPYPLDIVQTPDAIYIGIEVMHSFRIIHMDGRPMPADFKPTYLRYSAGRWEGDVLVVETNNLVEQLDQRTTPHSEEARIVERYRLDGVDAQGRRLLAAEVTMIDPKFYTEPLKFTRRWAQVPNGHLLPYECNEEVWRDRIDMLAEKKGAKVP